MIKTSLDYQKECCEQIQQDLLCVLDGMPDAMLTQVCSIVVDNFITLKQNTHNVYAE